MTNKLGSILIFTIIKIIHVQGTLCPCEDVKLCTPVTYSGKEVFAFVVKANRSVWENFDWTRLTTVVLANFYDPELMCFAHKNNARVVSLAIPSKDMLLDDQVVDKWIDTQLQYAKDRFLDGINIDIEYDIDTDSPYVNALSQLMSKLNTRFHSSLPHSQVTFDVPWSPVNTKGTGIDGRNYDFKALAQYTDFLFVMAYDEQSQIFGTECTARANSGMFETAGGITAYLDMGIGPDKLVLGLPWYGYFYKCIKTGPPGSDTCYIEQVPFRGVNCSDAAGQQLSYLDIQAYVTKYGTYYDEHSATRYVWYHDTDNLVRSIWFDDSFTLSLKIGFATYKNLRGTGIWNANMLDYSGSEKSKAMIADMWGTLPEYKKSYLRSKVNTL